MTDQSEENETESDCGGCCSGCSCSPEPVNMEELGPEAVELDRMFRDVDSHLVSALKARKTILETLQKRAAESPEMKEKMDKVLGAQHPVLIQFVFGQ